MKKNLIAILIPVVVLVVLFWTSAFYTLIPETEHKTTEERIPVVDGVMTVNNAKASATDYNTTSVTNKSTLGTGKQITDFALSLLGSPYVYAGMSPDGFDCSGFITYVFDRYNVNLPHSSKMQADEGVQVAKHEAQTGDLVIFTGTNPEVREPGHVGIVLSAPGDTIEFVHSSSNGGVKISKVQGTRYDIRFLEVRRVL
ncbi:C40 family peptidase [Pontibacter cellulosilyticus]|uniref:C40 family peptidase n=1 Tax=Pontibacter cellulosilyticus TaxID=1720253 RepID=A0A923N3B1_9BACT|nr:C40 family peptidase [Pontibacter cellulosilyticus]MBC5991384.1 C40 family peptidase [Pontibacter cellulosilyticus]